MNIPLLRRIQKQIAKEPRQFDMDCWFRFGPDIPNCGTAACLAGWALSCTAKKNPLQTAKMIRKNFGRSITIMAAKCRDIKPKARKLLGLSAGQADRLFHVSDWPMRFADAYRASDAIQSAKVAIARIDAFIKSKGAE